MHHTLTLTLPLSSLLSPLSSLLSPLSLSLSLSPSLSLSLYPPLSLSLFLSLPPYSLTKCLSLPPCVSSIVHSHETCVTCIHTELALNFDKVTDVILPHLPTSVLSVNRPEGRAAVVWIIGEYGEVLFLF